MHGPPILLALLEVDEEWLKLIGDDLLIVQAECKCIGPMPAPQDDGSAHRFELIKCSRSKWRTAVRLSLIHI
eukprot:8166420-Alexandrium_andersonii.AAC.1